MKDIFFHPHMEGDESKYLSDLIKANEEGLSKAISDGASITYLTITYFLDKFINNPLLTLKLTSLSCGFIMFFFLLFFSRSLKLEYPIKRSVIFWIIYLFLIQATIFIGVNDILLDLFGTLLFISFLTKFQNVFHKITVLGFFLALMLATRKMAFTYIIVFFLVYALAAIYNKEKNTFFQFKNGALIIITFLFCFCTMNFYPLIQHQRLSFDDKILGGNINWAQWDYHNALLIDQGKQERFKHINIKETEIYLNENGEHALPSSFSEMIIFDPKLTIKEFFIDSITGLKYILRQTGLLIFLFVFFFLYRSRRIFNKRTCSDTDFMYLFSAIYFFIICFIVVTNIQARWFMLFMPVMILLIGKDFNQFNKKKQLLFSIFNNILLIIMCFPYLSEKIEDFSLNKFQCIWVS